MTMNHLTIWRRVVAVQAMMLLAVLAAGQPRLIFAQELIPPGPVTPGPVSSEGQLPIPPQPQGDQPIGSQTRPECEYAPVDVPLSALTTDIRPRNTANGDVVDPEKLPFSCASLKPVQQQAVSLSATCDSCFPGCCDILSLANFSHKPLYFNDDKLERCGEKHCCCQPCASALCFYGGALLMPARVICTCPCKCVPSGGCCQ